MTTYNIGWLLLIHQIRIYLFIWPGHLLLDSVFLPPPHMFPNPAITSTSCIHIHALTSTFTHSHPLIFEVLLAKSDKSQIQAQMPNPTKYWQIPILHTNTTGKAQNILANLASCDRPIGQPICGLSRCIWTWLASRQLAAHPVGRQADRGSQPRLRSLRRRDRDRGL